MNEMPGREPLPAPEVPDLSADRHRELRDVFMQTITEQPQRTAARRRWALIIAPAATAAIAAAVVGAVALSGPKAGVAPVPGATEFVAPATVAIAPAGAAGPLLERIAFIASTRPGTTVGAGKFVYVHSRVAWTGRVGDGPGKLDPVHDREIWRPATKSVDGQFRENGEMVLLPDVVPNSAYADLPTDPDALLRRVYAEGEATFGKDDLSSPEDKAFQYLGEVLSESLLPPKVAAALYRAAARIPGVERVDDAVDAAGRHGVAVGRVDPRGERHEWIFDARTFEFLGERSYLVRDTDLGKAGMLTGTTAVLKRGVVDKIGQTPS